MTTSLTPLERALMASLSPPKFRDVHLYAFSRRTVYSDGSIRVDHPLPIAVIGSVLKNTEHFEKLLGSGFAESDKSHNATVRQYAYESEYDYETDSDLDEFEGFDPPPEPLSGPSIKGKEKSNAEGSEVVHGEPSVELEHRILLPNMAYRTLKACIFYLYTGKVNFLPLKSQGQQDREFSMLTAADCSPPKCSPKSMYRLAEAYGISDLQGHAYQEIISRLKPENIVEEAFTSFFARYDRLREDAVSVLSTHYSKPMVQKMLPAVIQRVVLGELPHAGETLVSLLGLR
ncbi:uncharacterized protein BXZ73DRAFT_17941, partial [Epithele typhae]|uniref:uncharacterized protein n=1 Tax=Epithele typhae TaxID=378194 RepID=UPI0020077657